MRWGSLPSPIGDLGVAVDDDGVCAVTFGPPPGASAADRLLSVAIQQLREYVEGARQEFDLPLVVRSGTGFERAVWKQIAGIGYGEMRTYGEIAAAVGDPGAARAVGVACNRNPLPIVVPCHRVVGAGGKLVGFGGGLDRKRFLLELEARVRIEGTFSADQGETYAG
jgi:methylated-DNA-[protein]-cysteine S-methyltransferase